MQKNNTKNSDNVTQPPANRVNNPFYMAKLQKINCDVFKGYKNRQILLRKIIKTHAIIIHATNINYEIINLETASR